MRIVFVSWRDLAHPQAGGSEVVVDHLAQGLTDRGHDVLLLAGRPISAHGYAVRSTGGTFGQYLGAPWQFLRHRTRADVVVDVENGIPFFAPWWQRQPVVCLVHHVHTEQWAMQFSAPVAAIGRWIEASMMPRAYRGSQFVAVSASTATSLEALGVPRTRITVIEMGLNRVQASGERSTTPRFLVLGRLVPHKRVEIALRVWPRVRAATGGELRIVGDGPELDRLRPMATPGVTFTGAVSEERKGEELCAAWLLLHPAHHEGWGTVVMEAATVGVPTIGFDVPGVRDSVADGITGVLVPDDESAFADAWISLATDADRRRTMAEAARDRAAGFTWARAVDTFATVLESTRRSA